MMFLFKDTFSFLLPEELVSGLGPRALTPKLHPLSSPSLWPEPGTSDRRQGHLLEEGHATGPPPSCVLQGREGQTRVSRADFQQVTARELLCSPRNPTQKQVDTHLNAQC